jgi:hypothetical protein
MYRQNEAALVGGVLERKLAGDRSGAVAAAVQLWQLPEERDEEPGAAHAEVWSALCAMSVVELALDAALAAMRGGERLRFDAFIDIGEAITDPATHLELAGLALDRGWDPDRYLAAALIRLVEANREDAVLEFITKRRDKLCETTRTWSVIAAIMTTTRVGNRQDLSSWFQFWWKCEGAPMWIAQAYAATVMEANDRAFDEIVKIAERALEFSVADVTAGYFVGVMAMADLRAGRDEAFRNRMSERGDDLTMLVALAPMSHPAALFHNRVNHAHPIEAADLVYEPMESRPVVAMLVAGAAGAPKRPFNYQTAKLLGTLAKSPVMIERALSQFVQIYDVARGSAEVIALCEAMRKTRPSELPWLNQPWERLVKARTTWLTRMRISLG